MILLEIPASDVLSRSVYINNNKNFSEEKRKKNTNVRLEMINIYRVGRYVIDEEI